ncbi:MAG TPA: DUF3570 domain-containing protein, partial [Polyangia bacterium]|nr:DUF3570 domain-containing protein [Polyangia bacterium]
MQLRALLRPGCAAALLVLAAPAARATQDAASRVTLFEEPSKLNKGVNVIHPQIDAGTTLGPDFRFGVGYNVDIVSGATPAIFGPHSGVDAVTTATKFSDLRQEAHGSLSYERPSSSVSVAYAYGWEHDYRSHAVTATTRSDLLDHNFTLGLSYTHNFDSVCDNNNSNVGDQPLDLKPLLNSSHCFNDAMTDVVSHRLSIDTFQPSLSWTATPRLILQLGSTIQILDGFQSNPYRSVQLGREKNTPQEHLPEFRQRYAVYGRAVYALPAMRSSALGMVRLYQDSWAVQAVSG